MELSKGKSRRIPLESLILFFVLFFPGIYGAGFSGETGSIDTIPFSALRELGSTLTYTIPSLALIWYLLSDKESFDASTGEKKCFLPWEQRKLRKRDFFSFGAGLSGLIITAFGLSFLASFFSQTADLTQVPKVEAPGNAMGWMIIVFSCLGTGYLEESYFRYYLLTRLKEFLPQPVMRIILSAVLFSMCHIYEGPWGILNAFLAGVFLSALFIHARSLHGIAWAHGVYNIFVYIIGNFL
jgi:membrane protease YdiL (CAAX protease family)